MANQSANPGLENPISVQSSYIAPDILLESFSEPYRRIVLRGPEDMGKVVNRANDAGYEVFCTN